MSGRSKRERKPVVLDQIVPVSRSGRGKKNDAKEDPEIKSKAKIKQTVENGQVEEISEDITAILPSLEVQPEPNTSKKRGTPTPDIEVKTKSKKNAKEVEPKAAKKTNSRKKKVASDENGTEAAEASSTTKKSKKTIEEETSEKDPSEATEKGSKTKKTSRKRTNGDESNGVQEVGEDQPTSKKRGNKTTADAEVKAKVKSKAEVKELPITEAEKPKSRRRAASVESGISGEAQEVAAPKTSKRKNTKTESESKTSKKTNTNGDSNVQVSEEEPSTSSDEPKPKKSRATKKTKQLKEAAESDKNIEEPKQKKSKSNKEALLNVLEPLAEITETVEPKPKKGRGTNKVESLKELAEIPETVEKPKRKGRATKKVESNNEPADVPETTQNEGEAKPKKGRATKKIETAKKPEKIPESIENVDIDKDKNEDEPKPKKGRSTKKSQPKPETQENDIEESQSKPKDKKLNSTETKFEDIDFSLDKEYNLKISSWNVAGLRSWLAKDGLKYVSHEKPDILCLQEIKCEKDKLPDESRIPGYHPYWLCHKGGYAGVAIYSKIMPINVEYGIGDSEQDEDGRIITAEYEKFFLICTYVPNSGRGLVTLPKRMKWNALFKEYVSKLNGVKPVIIAGDMNVSHYEIDLARPQNNKKNAGFTQEEREGMSDFLSTGFIDTFRHLYKDKEGAYTYWTYMANSRSKNVGWRLDYFLVSERIISKVIDNVIRSQVMGSDHCPITLFANF